ncbi:sugar transporter [Basidiobolus meristosporus CBS 931.73]|uniref:Sugar transporter n=2 Tax=Basidiobolus TaxID=4859 RepID=A0A1Y1Z2G1_9FUNG|nr:sugar transporter [Basidiobolus meristosporus CBS 931.73]ORY04108.1 sugar transporter [Basidiobolus meristosporus CBS 931.73]|eukprot:ORY04107.1 sugar transporter [Basidiobolus meristosporus CBS 931.73]
MGVLVYVASAAAAIGGFLFGYDTGVISGVLVMDRFKDRFGYADKPALEGFITSSLTLGCLIGSLSASYMADRFGRKFSIMMAGFCFTIGAALQCSSFEIAQLLIGRIIAGLAIGVLSMVVPLYQSEIAPREIRGTLVSMQQLAITIGILVAFLVNMGTDKLTTDASWRIPLGVQGFPALTLSLLMFFLPKSPRWLMSQGHSEQAMHVLQKLSNNPDEELEDITQTIRMEKEMAAPTWTELFRSGLRRRVFIGIAIQVFQQLTGINAIMYYAPTIFKSAGYHGNNAQLTATAINGAVNVGMTIPAVLYVDRIGRRPLLLIGAACMATTMVTLGALIAVYSPHHFEVLSAGKASIAMIYLFVAAFAFTWGPIGWIYPSEIYPNRVRAKCMSVTTASNWVFNFIIGEVVPPLMKSINWGLYIIFGACGVLMFIFVIFFVPETKGKSLEQIDHMFGGGAQLDEKTEKC